MNEGFGNVSPAYDCARGRLVLVFRRRCLSPWPFLEPRILSISIPDRRDMQTEWRVRCGRITLAQISIIGDRTVRGVALQSTDSFREFHAEATEWRRHLHRNPELGFRVEKTAQFVAEKLAFFGINYIAETGIVAAIQGEGGEGPTIGLRADMDALPSAAMIHTAMLLGASLTAVSLLRVGKSAQRNPGSFRLGPGGQKMGQVGFLDRFSISQVFGLHNTPGVEVGQFATCHGPALSSLDNFDLVKKGKSGHRHGRTRALTPSLSPPR
ncbi:hypothetical protein NKJ10_30640 [Mesorhizobium sp. M0204]|uniref:hypothetical protein n=1 Tax=Mesorhizobium sp. M0204 TaxID=2956913 RepID=UPI00333ABAD3